MKLNKTINHIHVLDDPFPLEFSLVS